MSDPRRRQDGERQPARHHGSAGWFVLAAIVAAIAVFAVFSNGQLNVGTIGSLLRPPGAPASVAPTPATPAPTAAPIN